MPPLSQFLEFFGNHPILASGLLGSVLLLVFSELTRKARAMTDLAPLDVVKLMNGDGVVLDARAAEQFAKGHLAGARNVAAADLTAGSEKLKRYQGKPLVIVCENGMASNRLAGTLRKQGVGDVYSLKGGLDAWQRDNLPLVAERKEKKPKQKKKKKQSA